AAGDSGTKRGVAAMSSTPQATETMGVVDRFNEAFNRHDVDAVMALMTEDCVFESTGPAPDGVRHAGQAAVRQAWVELFKGSPHAVFSVEEAFAVGDRCVQRWRYDWRGADG